jgi:hypothetical protein
MHRMASAAAAKKDPRPFQGQFDLGAMDDPAHGPQQLTF